ncbi:hypothetical protein [Hoeflea sp.]|uniref:hypothetical protein n=1 Tax=Hoeflea sp. TaxID=1940281 RepID=UPI003B016BF4
MHGGLSADDVIDAEFEHVDDEIRPTKPVQRRTAAANDIPAGNFGKAEPRMPPHMNLFSNKSPRPKRVRQRSTAGFAFAVATLCLIGFWLAGGHALFAGAGGSSGHGLTLSSVAVDPLRVQNKSYFVLHGVISNRSSDAQAVPLLAIETGEAADGQVPFYARAGKEQLAAGESTRFRVRVPSGVRDYDQLTISLAGGGTAR